MKDDGGAVGLTECPATLQKWMFSGPEMARVIIEFERCVDRALCMGARSAEDIPGRCDVTKICDWRIWQSISQTSSDLLVLDTRDVVEKCVVDNVYRIKSLGFQQYDNLYGNGNSRVKTIFLKS